jgi:hypothetical protein
MSGELRTAVVMVGWVLYAIAGCANGQALSTTSGQMVAPATVDPLAAAAAQATAIVQQAQATALVLKAQAQATAVMAQASAPDYTPTPAPTMAIELTTEDPPLASLTPAAPQGDENEPRSVQVVEVMRVGFAGEGGLIHVQFRAPPEVAEKWWQGSASVTDEGNGAVYNEIPVLPRIGPLIGRPKREGQLGYVMLVNTPPGLRPGALVTVVLGGYTFEHVQVQ